MKNKLKSSWLRAALSNMTPGVRKMAATREIRKIQRYRKFASRSCRGSNLKAGFCGAYCNENLAETGLLCGAAATSGDVPPGVCGLGICLPSCDTARGDVGANGCPTDTGLPNFACYPADGSYGGEMFMDPAGTAPAGFCLPACESTADCGLLWVGVVSCNTTSGVCG